ncbi:prolyl oligopeptidase family serine peptidase, partial [Acidaminococcus fermentans]|uniref:prolyl oligopeptidase family serine peptidase n=1 Tax=Acidaminococcus fermentans TaxID=905 RepID=UPI001F25B83E
VGGSAGGYLSAFAGTTSGTRTFDKGENLQESSQVNCAVDLYGLSDLSQVGMDYSPEVQQLHKSAGATEALWVNGSPVFGGKDGGVLADPKATEAANPIAYIGKNSAPMLLMHGTADKVVSPGQTDLLYQALKAKGVPAERYEIPGAAHGGVYWPGSSPWGRILGAGQGTAGHRGFLRQISEVKTVPTKSKSREAASVLALEWYG